MSRIRWTPEEIDSMRIEGLRLVREETEPHPIGALLKRAQLVLPKDRRREINTISKVGWFVQAVNVARNAAKAPKRARSVKGAISLAPPVVRAPVAPPIASPIITTERASHSRVFWKDSEKLSLCETAARLLTDLGADSPRDALEKAIVLELPAERRRKIFSMTQVADWYFDGLREQRELLRIQRELKVTDEAIAAKHAEEAAASAAEAAKPTPPTPPASLPGLLAAFGGWAQIREYLVQELASIVAEGVQRGMTSTHMHPAPAAPQDTKPEPGEVTLGPTKHVPFVADKATKDRPPSVLVVGLKEATAAQIAHEFGKTLDMRFFMQNKNGKDQLRSMVDHADVTVAVTDFLSHSTSGICKSRSAHYVESTGGMTRLRSQLTQLVQLAQLPTNGAAHAV